MVFSLLVVNFIVHLLVKLVDGQGVEPRMPEAGDLQSPVVASATRHPNSVLHILYYVVGRRRVELR